MCQARKSIKIIMLFRIVSLYINKQNNKHKVVRLLPRPTELMDRFLNFKSNTF